VGRAGTEDARYCSDLSPDSHKYGRRGLPDLSLSAAALLVREPTGITRSLPLWTGKGGRVSGAGAILVLAHPWLERSARVVTT